MQLISRFFFIAACLVPAILHAGVEATWIGDPLFTMRSAFFDQNARTGEIAIYLSDLDGGCEAVRVAMGKPNERALEVTLEKRLHEVMIDGEMFDHYPVMMSAADELHASAWLVASDGEGKPMLDIMQSPIDILDKESIAQHGSVLIQHQEDGSLRGMLDVYFGGLDVGRARRTLVSFEALQCDIPMGGE